MMDRGMPVISQGEIVDHNGGHRKSPLLKPADGPGHRQPQEGGGRPGAEQTPPDTPTQGRNGSRDGGKLNGFRSPRASADNFLVRMAHSSSSSVRSRSPVKRRQ